MAVQIQFRRGTAAEWTSANPTLAEGEMGIETDTDQFKVGDGATAWNSLAYGGLQGPTGPTGAAGLPGANGANGQDLTAVYTEINTQAGTTYTLAANDYSKLTSFTSSSSITVTVPLNSSVSIPVGACIDLIQSGVGQATIQGAGGVTVNCSVLPKTRTQYSIVSLIKMATDSWVLTGDLAVV